VLLLKIFFMINEAQATGDDLLINGMKKIDDAVSILLQGSDEVTISHATEFLLQSVTIPSLHIHIFDSLMTALKEIDGQNSVLNVFKRILESDMDNCVIEGELLGRLSTIIKTGTEKQKASAAIVLGYIAQKNDELRNAILKYEGLTSALVSVLRSDMSMINHEIQKLSDQNEATDDLGNIPTYISLLREGSKINIQTKRSMTALVLRAQETALESDAKLINEFLVDLGEGQTQMASSFGRVVRKMARDQTEAHRQELISSGVVQSIIDIIARKADKERQAEAFWILGVLADNDFFQSIILEHKALDCIVDALDHGCDDEKSEAFWTLEHMCISPTLRRAVFEAGAIPGLVKFMKHGTYLAKAQGLRVLSFLVEDQSVDGDHLTEAALIQRLLPVVRAGPGALKTSGGQILYHLAAHTNVSHLENAFLEADAPGFLMGVALSADEDVSTKVHSYNLLKLLVANPHITSTILANFDWLTSLIDNLRGSEDAIKYAVARVIGACAKDNKEACQLISQVGATPVLLSMLSRASCYEDKIVAVEILSIFAEDEPMRDVLFNAHLIPLLDEVKEEYRSGELHDQAKALKHRIIDKPTIFQRLTSL
jgi:hypothetical protein